MNEIFKLIADSGRTDLMEEWYEIERKLEVLEILKPRVYLKREVLKDLKADFIEATGYVLEDENEFQLVKWWLENES